MTVGMPVVKSSLLNASSDDLWTDTDDESFVRATQCVLDAATNSFTSPVAVVCSTAVTSTPNVKSARCRRTFCLDPAPTVPRRMNMRPRGAGLGTPAFSSLPVATSSPLRDASYSEELLATLAEPDDILDSQVKLTDAAVASDRLIPTSSSAVERLDVCNDNTKTGMSQLVTRFVMFIVTHPTSTTSCSRYCYYCCDRYYSFGWHCVQEFSIVTNYENTTEHRIEFTILVIFKLSHISQLTFVNSSCSWCCCFGVDFLLHGCLEGQICNGCWHVSVGSLSVPWLYL